jgi:hypothetical protein
VIDGVRRSATLGLGLALVLAAACAPVTTADSPRAPVAAADSPYAPFRDSPPEMGGLRSHSAVVTQRDLIVYRFYDSRASQNRGVAGRMGAFWTDFTVATEAQARDQLAVCKGWNNMARLVRCTLPKASTVVRGPGQDANCAVIPNSESTTYHPGGAPQLFLSNPDAVLRDCSDTETGW